MSKPADPRDPSDPGAPLSEGIFNKLIGLGDTSTRKSYYPQLRNKISELEQEQCRLEQLSAFLDDIIESMPSALVAVDRDGVVTRINTRAREAERAQGRSPGAAASDGALPLHPRPGRAHRAGAGVEALGHHRAPLGHAGRGASIHRRDGLPLGQSHGARRGPEDRRRHRSSPHGGDGDPVKQDDVRGGAWRRGWPTRSTTPSRGSSRTPR